MTRYLFALVLLVACSKKKEEVVTPPVYQFTESQLVGSWKITSMTSSEPYQWYGSTTSSTNMFVGTNACATTNLYILRSDRTSSATYCTTNYANANWKVESDVYYFRQNGLAAYSAENITQITATQFTTTYLTDKPSGSGTTTVTTVYTKQ